MNYVPQHLTAHTADERHTVYRLHGDGGYLAIPTPPAPAHETDHARNIVGAAVEALDGLEAARKKVDVDQGLTAIGKAEKLADIRRATEAAVAKAAADLEAYQAHCASYEAKLFAPAKIEPTDAVTVAEDVEIRTMLRGMSASARAEVLRDIAASPRMMEAVLRSPVPVPGVTEPVNHVWRDHIAKTHPEYPAFLRHKGAAEWAAQIIPQVRQAVGTAQRSAAELAQAEIERRQAA